MPGTEAVIRNPLFREFLEKAIQAKAYIPLPGGRIPEDKWFENLGITVLSTLGPFNLREVGKQFRVSHEQVRQIRKGTITRLWENSPTDLKSEFQLEDLLVSKKSVPFRMQQSQREGKRVQEFKQLFEGQGLAGVEAAGFSSKEVCRYREALRKRGIIVPYKNADWNDLREQLREEHDDITTQELLNQVDRTFLASRKQAERPLVVSLKSILEGLGLTMYSKKVARLAEHLTNAAIPIHGVPLELSRNGRIITLGRYYVCAWYDARRIEEFIGQNPGLTAELAYPIKIIGEQDKNPRPTTFDLLSHNGYVSVRTALDGIPGVHRSRYDKAIKGLFENSPYPVYFYKGTHFVREPEARLFRTYVMSSLN